jgi:pyruvate-formate lyase
LLLDLFEKWRSKPCWISEKQTGHLFDGKTGSELTRLAHKPVAVRKASAIARMLELITDPAVSQLADSFSIHPDEIVVGNLPPFSVGQGKEFVRYLREDEQLEGALNYLNELSPMGHIVPDHHRLLEVGLHGLIDECRERAKRGRDSASRRAFYESVIIALEAVINYADRYASLAEEVSKQLPPDDPNHKSLQEVAKRLRHTPANKPETFHEALQAIFIVHCAFHWTVEIVPIGRFDQLLYPFYKADIAAGRLTRESAQEILDCLWIKLDERVIQDHRHAEDRFTSSDGVLTGSFGASFFDQGGLLNQWMQQITIGGVVANDNPEPEDATNDITYLCLEAARRLPLNSPTLDLRVHSKTPRELIEAAAETLLSGGAHPVLLNDDRIIRGLMDTGGHVRLRSARNYACDGCYETMFAGETEFSFGFVPALDALEKALNRGAGLASAGPLHLRGAKDSWRTAPAREIHSFEKLWDIMREHILLGCDRYLNNVLTFYGNKERFCPSPLLSAFIRGCIESGRDLSAGGARYHIFSPLMVGISTAVDSLYAIKDLVFDKQAFSLEELVACLATNWGNNSGAPVRFVPSERIEEIRLQCISLPKFGQGLKEVDQLAWQLIETFADCVKKARENPVHRSGFQRLHERYDIKGEPFEILLAPGVGTFEQYVFSGSMAGASADGRRAGGSIASDLSPSPMHADQDPLPNGSRHARMVPLLDGLISYDHASMDLLPDGGPADYNIPEDFPAGHLADVIEQFAKGHGGSVCTFTVADPTTLRDARASRDDYNLVRVRMGGWTEFFVCLFPQHQEQHRRRPLYVAKGV